MAANFGVLADRFVAEAVTVAAIQNSGWTEEIREYEWIAVPYM